MTEADGWNTGSGYTDGWTRDGREHDDTAHCGAGRPGGRDR